MKKIHKILQSLSKMAYIAVPALILAFSSNSYAAADAQSLRKGAGAQIEKQLAPQAPIRVMNRIGSGNGQSTLVGTSFSKTLSVLVQDIDLGGVTPPSNVGNVTVIFSAPGSGASTTRPSFATTTNSAGIASFTPTANMTAGAYTVIAVAPNDPVRAASFNLTNVGAPPPPPPPPLVLATLELLEGNNQSAMIGREFNRVVVRAMSTLNTPIPNLTINFDSPLTAPTASWNSLAVNNSYANTTNASGISWMNWMAFGAPGSYTTTATATLNGITKTVTFKHTNLRNTRPPVDPPAPIDSPCKQSMLTLAPC